MLSNAKNVSEEPPLDLGDQIISQRIKRELVMFTASRHQKVRDREHREKMKQFEKIVQISIHIKFKFTPEDPNFLYSSDLIYYI
jgi:hypothetical protein